MYIDIYITANGDAFDFEELVKKYRVTERVT